MKNTQSEVTKTNQEQDSTDRAEPGEKGTGDFYRIEIRDSDEFATFRTHDVGDPGGIERIAGQRDDGSWDTQAWLISKNLAEVDGNTLKTSSEDVQEVFDQLGSKPRHVKGDIFRAEAE